MKSFFTVKILVLSSQVTYSPAIDDEMQQNTKVKQCQADTVLSFRQNVAALVIDDSQRKPIRFQAVPLEHAVNVTCFQRK